MADYQTIWLVTTATGPLVAYWTRDEAIAKELTVPLAFHPKVEAVVLCGRKSDIA